MPGEQVILVEGAGVAAAEMPVAPKGSSGAVPKRTSSRSSAPPFPPGRGQGKEPRENSLGGAVKEGRGAAAIEQGAPDRKVTVVPPVDLPGGRVDRYIPAPRPTPSTQS